MNSTNFYLTLPSNTMTEFAQNTAAEFRVKLPYSIQLQENWEIALVELQYSKSWNNLESKKEGNWILITMGADNDYYTGLIELTIPDGNYTDIKSLIKAIDIAVINWRPKNKKLDQQVFLPQIFEISYNKTYKRVKLKFNTRAIKGVVLGLNLQYILGFGSQMSHAFTKHVNIATYPPDITCNLNTLFVYTDLVEYQVVGNVLAPLLRTVPITGVYGETVGCVFLSPHYLRLRKKSFDSVEINIRDSSGENIGFQFGITIVKLHLRQQKR